MKLKNMNLFDVALIFWAMIIEAEVSGKWD